MIKIDYKFFLEQYDDFVGLPYGLSKSLMHIPVDGRPVSRSLVDICFPKIVDSGLTTTEIRRFSETLALMSHVCHIRGGYNMGDLLAFFGFSPKQLKTMSHKPNNYKPALIQKICCFASKPNHKIDWGNVANHLFYWDFAAGTSENTKTQLFDEFVFRKMIICRNEYYHYNKIGVADRP